MPYYIFIIAVSTSKIIEDDNNIRCMPNVNSKMYQEVEEEAFGYKEEKGLLPLLPHALIFAILLLLKH